MSKTRLAALPDLPTVDEAGVPGLYLLQWNAVWAPKGTPRDIVMKLNQAIVSALADPVGAPAAGRSRTDDLSCRPANARSARRISEGRDGQVGADHRVGQYQGRVRGCPTSHHQRQIKKETAMQTRIFGRSGIKLSILGFGCGAVGGLMVRGDASNQDAPSPARSRPASTISTPRCNMAMANPRNTLAAFCKT